MLNQAVVEALYSATYIENYLDCVENLPNDLQRYVSRLRELDATCQSKFTLGAPSTADSSSNMFLASLIRDNTCYSLTTCLLLLLSDRYRMTFSV